MNILFAVVSRVFNKFKLIVILFLCLFLFQSNSVKAENKEMRERYNAARLYALSGQTNLAAAEYEIILNDHLKSNPRDLEMRAYLGQLLYSQKRYLEAIEEFKVIVSFDKDNSKNYYLLGSLYLEVKDYEKAVSNFQAALKLSPKYHEVLNSLGYLYVTEGRYQEGVAFIKKALDIEPKNGAYLDSLGWAHFKMGQYEEALSVLLKATDLLKDPVIYQHIEEVYLALDKPIEAEEYRRRYNKLMESNALLE